MGRANGGSQPDSDRGGEPLRVAPGVTIDDRYRIVERIGSGAMGTVYRVEHLRLGRSFALKMLRAELADDPKMVDRFERESRVASSLTSEHVVPIVDSGRLRDGVPYFVMHLLEGSDLGALLRKLNTLAPARAVNLAIDACRGLSAAHAKGLVHRDLKPANLFITVGDDGRDVLKLLDFGVAKVADANTTRPGSLIGTARYMAPEQIGLDVEVGPATDVFAVGLILYECLAGEVPFAADTTERTIYKIMTTEAPPLEERCPALPRGLAEVVHTALAKDPRDRYASARAFADALAPFSGNRAPFAADLAPLSDTDPGETLAERDAPSVITAVSSAQSLPLRQERSQASAARRWLPPALAAIGGAVAAVLVTRALAEGPEPARPAEVERPSAPIAGSGTAELQTEPAHAQSSTRELSLEPGATSLAGTAAAPDAPSASVTDAGRPRSPTSRPAATQPPLARKLPPISAPRAKPQASGTPSPGTAGATRPRTPPAAAFDPQNPYAP